jgi:hypothetical protein
MVDTSNYKSLKLVPVLFRYFIPRKGVQITVMEFHNLKGETADVLTTYTWIYRISTSYQTKLLPFVGITVTQISEELQENEQCVFQAND